VYITVGGGGLISGIAAYLKIHRPNIEIIGCQPARSREMSLSVRAGRVVDDPEAGPTLSDGSAGPLEPDSITFPICQALVDRWMVIPEEEIEEALRRLYRYHGMVVEGAAGVAYAAALREREQAVEGDKVVILCGGNIDPARFEKIVQAG
jgi:threonine dehydratase